MIIGYDAIDTTWTAFSRHDSFVNMFEKPATTSHILNHIAGGGEPVHTVGQGSVL